MMLLVLGLLLASPPEAMEGGGKEDDCQQLLRHAGLAAALQPGQALSPEKARIIWSSLLENPPSLRSFGPRTVLARLLRDAFASGQSVAYGELRARTARFRRLVVVRPDGYVTVAVTGTPIAGLGRPRLHQGEWYAQGLRVGAFYFDHGGVFYAVDAALQKQGNPVGELPLGRAPVTAALLGAEDALGEMVRGLATLLTEPVRTLEGLVQLPAVVAGLIATSPEYFARYGAMNLEDQIREAARLSTHVLTLQGGAAAAGPRLASGARLPVLGLSTGGALVVREVLVPAGVTTAVVGAGVASASVVLMAQAGPTGSGAPEPKRWPPPPEGPGEWVEKAERMPPESRRYQSQVTGAPEGWVYRIRTGPGARGHVDLDGYVGGVLLDAKGPGYLELLRKIGGAPYFRGIEEMIRQAKNQRQVSGGLPIRWHFAEKEVAEVVRRAFIKAEITYIEIVHTPLLP